MTSTIALPMTLKNGRQIKNRLFKSAMSEQLGLHNRDPSAALINLYQQWAVGGCGLLVSGNIMVDRNHIGEPRNVVLDEASDLAVFSEWATAGSGNNTEFWAQLNHPGKQSPSFVNRQPIAPSAISLGLGLEKVFLTPKAMTEEEILYTIGRYANAAALAKKAGFTGVQIHGAHGYLVSQFLSPRHNQRDDQWGGSLENRMRFALAVYHAIRDAVGADFPVAIKLNSADFMDGGFTEDDSMQVVQALATAGIDLIEVSGGTYESPEMAQETAKASTRKREAFFMDYAEKIRALVDVPLVVTGGFRSTRGMNEALATGALDMIGIARPMAIDPNVPNQALASADFAIDLPHLTTGIKAIDKMAAHNIYWYEYQLWRLGKGRSPKPNLSPWRSFAATMMLNGKYMWMQRRA
jgi:2,4-dienoyl-CoA reductase-like NADH-dependent reductase (Old Yellow Enzyme family)